MTITQWRCSCGRYYPTKEEMHHCEVNEHDEETEFQKWIRAEFEMWWEMQRIEGNFPGQLDTFIAGYKFGRKHGK